MTEEQTVLNPGYIVLDDETQAKLLDMVRELSACPFDMPTLENAYRARFGELPEGGFSVGGADSADYFVDLNVPGVIGLIIDDFEWGIGFDDGYDYHFSHGKAEDDLVPPGWDDSQLPF